MKMDGEVKVWHPIMVKGSIVLLLFFLSYVIGGSGNLGRSIFGSCRSLGDELG